jgi:outer membrane lipoprotein-sorting protein
MSKRGLGIAVVAALLLGLAGSARADDAEDIVRKADQVRRPGESFIWKVTITSTEGDKAPTTDGFEVFVKGTRRSFVRFVAPARNLGRSLLALDRDLWIYLPDAGKPVRIPLAQRLVGQVANGDLARVDYAGDYEVTLLGSESVEGVACQVLDLKAKTKDVTYAAIKYWVAREAPRPVKAEFYAGTGTLLKTGTFDPPKDLDGRRLVTRLTFVDAIRKDRKSVMDFGEVKVRDLPDKYFDKNYMKTLD